MWSDETGGAFTSSRRVALICGLVVVAFAFQAVGPVATLTQPARAATVDLHVGFLESVDSLNPFRGLNDPSYELYGMIYDYLYSLDQDGNLVPNLATDAHADAYGANWTYTIRQGVNWSDGTPFTAADVNFTFNYNIQNFFQLWANEPYVNRIVQCAAKTRPYCGAVQTGPWQVTVYFDRPFVPGKAVFIPIIQQAQWSGIAASTAQYKYDNPNPIGTGPFVADANIYNEWLNSQPLLVHKNPNYHPVGNHTGPSKIDNIYFQQYNDESTLVAAVKAGTIDLAKLTPAGYGALAGSPNVGRQEGLISTQYWNEIGISQYDATSLKLNPARFDINVRRALAKATNKDYILNTIYQGKGVRGDSLMSPITPQWWYDPSNDPTPWQYGGSANLTFDVAAANDLLNRSGYTTWTGGSFGSGFREATNTITLTNVQTNLYPNGTTKTVPAGTILSFTMDVRQEFIQEQDTATYLKLAWSKVGVQVTIQVKLESALSADVYGGAVEMYIWYWSGDPDPNYLMSIQSAYTLDGWSDNYYDNSTYNWYYVNMLAAFNVTQREALVKAGLKVQYESAVYMIYIYPYGEWAYRTDHFTGWGDWNAHPYRQMDAFWGANPLFLELQGIAGQVGDHRPTKPVILGTFPIKTFVNTSQSFTGTSSDADANQTLTWTWNWGDGSQTLDSTPSSATSDSTNHTWKAPGYYNISLNVYDGQLGNSSDLYEVIVLNSTATGHVNGTVNDAKTTAPITDAVVFASGGFQASTDSTGAYSLRLPAGTYSLLAIAPLYLPGVKTGVTVTVGVTTTANFLLNRAVGWITGTVTSTAGGPIANVGILAVSPGYTNSTHTDPNGHYNVTVAIGVYNVTAQGWPGYTNSTVKNITVGLGAAVKQDFQLEPTTTTGTGLSSLIFIGIGAAVIIAVVAVVAFLLVRRRKQQETQEKIDIPKKQ